MNTDDATDATDTTGEKGHIWEFPEDKPYTHNHPEDVGKATPEKRRELPEEWGQESFPASDPPANY